MNCLAFPARLVCCKVTLGQATVLTVEEPQDPDQEIQLPSTSVSVRQ